VDLACPINTGSAYNWHSDDLRPTLTISSPRQNRNQPPLTSLRIGLADAYSGISNGTLSVKGGLPVNGLAASTELAGQGSFIETGIFAIPLATPITNPWAQPPHRVRVGRAGKLDNTKSSILGGHSGFSRALA
jgi:hypothetical protein